MPMLIDAGERCASVSQIDNVTRDDGIHDAFDRVAYDVDEDQRCVPRVQRFGTGKS